MDKSAKWVLTLLVMMLVFVLWLGYYSTKACYSEGGEIVGTGQYSTTYVNSGGVLIPVTNEIMACEK